MARTYARLLISIWKDPDWLALTSSQQTTYLALVGSQDLSYCGVAPYLPQRLIGSSVDLTAAKVKAGIAALEVSRFLVIDETTAEVCVRSYVRHDEVMKVPNVAKGMADALTRVRSNTIRNTIIAELSREFHENPQAKGWDALAKARPELFHEVGSNASVIPFPNQSPDGSPNRSAKG